MRQHSDLAGDFAGAEVADETHLARQAERACHRAADLGRDAEGLSWRVRDVHRLDVPAVVESQQKLRRAVGRCLSRLRRPASGSRTRPPAASRSAWLRFVISIEAGDGAAIDPLKDLTAVKRRHAEPSNGLLHFSAIEFSEVHRRSLTFSTVGDGPVFHSLGHFGDRPHVKTSGVVSAATGGNDTRCRRGLSPKPPKLWKRGPSPCYHRCLGWQRIKSIQ